jgi:hypothetical protein
MDMDMAAILTAVVILMGIAIRMDLDILMEIAIRMDLDILTEIAIRMDLGTPMLHTEDIIVVIIKKRINWPIA